MTNFTIHEKHYTSLIVFVKFCASREAKLDFYTYFITLSSIFIQHLFTAKSYQANINHFNFSYLMNQ